MLPLRLSSQDWCAFTNRPSGLTVDLSFIKNLQRTAVSSLSPAGFAHHRAPATARLFLPLTPTLRVHHPRRVVTIDPDAEARQKQHEKEQARRKRLTKQRAETLDDILDRAPATFTAPQLRVLIRALIHIDSYHFADDVAAHFVRDDENNQQTREEVLLSVVDGLEDDKLSGSPSPATRVFPARTRSTIWPRLKLSSLNRSPKRLRRRRPHPRRPR
jgi:hypothetical protein